MSDRLEQALSQLEAEGFCVLEGLFPPELLDALRREAEQAGGKPAGIGRDTHQLLQTDIRQTRIAWLDGATPAQSAFLARAEELRILLNQRFFFGLFEFEGQFGITDPGGFYQRHLDSFAGARNRLVSLVTYLNPTWDPAQGGELLIWRGPGDHGPPLAVVWPQAGTSVLMLSEEIPHEVRPTRAKRYAIAGWWRINRSND